MKRQEIADGIESLQLFAWSQASQNTMDAAVAELRKSCGGCKWFLLHPNNRWSACAAKDGLSKPPADGSGFCHKWDKK